MKTLVFSVVALTLIVTQFPYTSIAAMSPNKKQKALERVHFAAYNGQQQDWPTSQKPALDIQNTKYGVPIYRDLPGKPYVIIGFIKTAGSSTLKHAVEGAQAAGAEAILIAEDKAFAELGMKPQLVMRGTSSGKVDYLE